jgi:hypothetical protein
VTGPELKQLRQDLDDAIGRPLSAADMAKLCGLEGGNGVRTSHPVLHERRDRSVIHSVECGAARPINPEACALAPCGGHSSQTGRVSGSGAMSSSDTGFNFDRYRRLLAEADDEPKRLAFINLLIEEKARDRLAEQSLRARLSGMGLQTNFEAQRARAGANGTSTGETRFLARLP